MMQLKLSFALLCIFSLLLVSSIILYFHIQPSGLPLRNESYVSLPKQMEKCQSAPAMKTNIFFLKTHKTAGTTIYSILSRFGARHSLNFMLPKHDRFDLGSEGPVKFKDINSETVPLDKKFNIFAFHSRYSRETNKFLYPDVMRVTILRSPPEHLESVFSFYGIKRRLKVSFHEFVEAPTKAPEGEVSRAAHTVWNEMSRDLGMNKSDFESNQKIGEFIRFVDQEFHLVMIAEHLEASLVLLADLMSWPLHYVASIPIHVRRSKSRSSISYEDRRMVLQFHRADHLLYQVATEIHEISQSKNLHRKNDKIIEIKIFNFTLKLTNWRKLEKQDYVVFFFYTIAFLLLGWTILFVPVVLLLLYLYPSSGSLLLLYYTWIYFDRETPFKGSKPSSLQNYPRIFKAMQAGKSYFPIRLIKTADLPAERNYILACYPHGVIPVHALTNFSTNLNNKDELFPGVSMRVAAHNILLHVPLMREVYLNLIGGCSCSASSLKYILNSEPSKAVVLYPGGVSEVSLAYPGDTYRIIKNRRKGFIRIALQTGTSLVPVFTFGEINLWEKYTFRSNGKSTFGLDLVTINGRGFFQNHFGLLPRSVPINTVVGQPIPVPKMENPSTEMINEYHEKFFNALQSLFEENKLKYDTAAENAKLIMI